MRAAAEGDPMRYCQGILQVVNCIYAAACGEIPWEQTLAEICQVGRLDGCALSMVDQVARGAATAAAARAKLSPLFAQRLSTNPATSHIDRGSPAAATGAEAKEMRDQDVEVSQTSWPLRTTPERPLRLPLPHRRSLGSSEVNCSVVGVDRCPGRPRFQEARSGLARDHHMRRHGKRDLFAAGAKARKGVARARKKGAEARLVDDIPDR